jgi:molybdopterin-guanine dinucleotide biosynthesis protein A
LEVRPTRERETSWKPARPQPLCAIYARSCLPVVQTLSAGGVPGQRGSSLTGFLERLQVRWVGEAQVALFGPPERLFFNVNTPEDLLRARELAVDS